MSQSADVDTVKQFADAIEALKSAFEAEVPGGRQILGDLIGLCQIKVRVQLGNPAPAAEMQEIVCQLRKTFSDANSWLILCPTLSASLHHVYSFDRGDQ